VRGRLVVFLLGAIVIFAGAYVAYSALDTLQRLNMVEAERDTWQRPGDVLQALALKPGDVVADLGSGAGYFALKISPIAGSRGQVLAVDIRKLSLAFLWMRAATRVPHNVQIIVGGEDDPRLPRDGVDAVLIANTFHELKNPEKELDHVSAALRANGRLVIVDRGPGSENSGHEIPLETAERDVKAKGFEIARVDDRFVDRAGDEPWWLLVARKP